MSSILAVIQSFPIHQKFQIFARVQRGCLQTLKDNLSQKLGHTVGVKQMKEKRRERLKVILIQKHGRGSNWVPARTCIIVGQQRYRCSNLKVAIDKRERDCVCD